VLDEVVGTAARATARSGRRTRDDGGGVPASPYPASSTALAPANVQPVAGYRPFAELTRGSAVVYKAYDPRRKRTVLLKVLTPEAAEDPALVAWFEGEARAVSEVVHENVVVLYEAGRDGARPYLVAEFVEGRSLAEVLAEGPLPAELAAYVAASAARGLAAAHKRGVLHRDVKPSNVLLAADGKVKLTDFGLATRAGAGDGHGAGVRGTPGYLAPELVGGAPPAPAADLFALGAVLVESVTGRQAFASTDAADALDVALHHDPLPAMRADPRVPSGLADVASHLLAKAPDGRTATAAVAAHALDVYRGSGATRAGAADLAAFLDDPAAYRAARATRLSESAAHSPGVRAHPLRRARTLVAAGLALGVVAATILVLRPDRETALPSPPAPAESAGGVDIAPAPTNETGPTDAEAADPGPSMEEVPVALPLAEASGEAETAPAGGGSPDQARVDAPREEDRPPPAAPATGQLTVAVEPWAEVFVNDRSVGITPLGGPLTLPPGAHRVVLRNPEFPEHSQQVEIPSGGSERIAVSLWASVARLSVEVSPWAQVSVDGRPVGTTPLRRALVLRPGAYAIRLTHPTLGAREERVTVAAGESRTLRVRMGDG